MMIGNPYRYRGAWLWPVDGHYDVHLDDNGRPSDDPDAEVLTLSEAKAWVDDGNFTAAVDRAFR